MRFLLFAVLIAALAGCSQPSATAQRDKTDSEQAPTASDQSQRQPDLDVTAQIRQEIVADKNMSVNARNVKIITEVGKVTLRGVVSDAAEKESIERIASKAAGERQVESLLEIAQHP